MRKKLLKSVKPGDLVVKIVHDTLVELLSFNLKANDFDLILNKSPSIVLMVCLQGSGKTTTAAKLANLLKNKICFYKIGQLIFCYTCNQQFQLKFATKYISVGSNMGKAINIAVAFDAYILSDKATWLNHKNKGNLEIQFEGDPLLHNQYSFLPINKNKHSHVESKLVKRIEEWLVSERAKKLINSYIIDEEQVFTFNAK